MMSSNLVRAGVLLIAGFLVLSHRMDLALLVLAVFLNASTQSGVLLLTSGGSTRTRAVRITGARERNLDGYRGSGRTCTGPVLGSCDVRNKRSLPFFADAAAMILSWCEPDEAAHGRS